MNTNFMQYAIDIAKKSKYYTYTNPLVGAVVVYNNQVIGEGYHQKYGLAHAEVNAIESVKDKKLLSKAILYVTLEPCAHYGKTNPCANKIIDSGIKKVIIAQKDPNPIVSGRGIQLLLDNKIDVEIGLLEDEAYKLNIHYNIAHKNKKPFVCLKFASSLNGKSTLRKDTNTKITNSNSLQDLYGERKEFHAILIGSQTAIIDNPILSIRDNSFPYPPIRVVLDRRFRLTDNLHLLKDDTAKTWIFTENKKAIDNPNLYGNHVSIFFEDKWDIDLVLKVLYEEGIQSVMVEGGSKIHASFIQSKNVNEILLYLSPLLFFNNGLDMIENIIDFEDYIYLSQMEIIQLGDNLKIRAIPKYINKYELISKEN